MLIRILNSTYNSKTFHFSEELKENYIANKTNYSKKRFFSENIEKLRYQM